MLSIISPALYAPYLSVNCFLTTSSKWRLSTTFPIIGREELFEGSGNRLTKSNTISYRGEQNTILREYGTCFKLVRFKTYFKLENIEIKQESDDLSEEENYLNDLN